MINKQGIAAVNGTEVAKLGLRLPDLEMGEVLGKGASSLVRKARHTPTQTDLAVKIVNVFDKSKRDQLIRELRTLYSSAFPWLVAFHDCLYDDGAMYIVLECASTPSPLPTHRACPQLYQHTSSATPLFCSSASNYEHHTLSPPPGAHQLS